MDAREMPPNDLSRTNGDLHNAAALASQVRSGADFQSEDDRAKSPVSDTDTEDLIAVFGADNLDPDSDIVNTDATEGTAMELAEDDSEDDSEAESHVGVCADHNLQDNTAFSAHVAADVTSPHPGHTTYMADTQLSQENIMILQRIQNLVLEAVEMEEMVAQLQTNIDGLKGELIREKDECRRLLAEMDIMRDEGEWWRAEVLRMREESVMLVAQTQNVIAINEALRRGEDYDSDSD